MNEVLQSAIVSEAMAWLNTPYHHAANVRGAGIDCAMLLVEVFKAVGLVPDNLDPRPYPHDFHLHRDEERYLGWLEKYADPIPEGSSPQPGDVATFQFGRCVSHAGIVTRWPEIVHAYLENRSVILTDVVRSGALAERLRTVYRIRT